MNYSLELIVLLLMQLLGTSTFARFEVETPALRKIFKWLIVDAVTVGLYFLIRHWALIFPAVILTVGSTIISFGARKIILTR